MGTAIIVIILLLIVFFALKGSLKHFKGEGGCCGGSPAVKVKKKKLEGTVVAEKVIYIDGMHCENCRNSVEGKLNAVDGAVAKVNLNEKMAVVSMDRMIEDAILKKAVEDAGFTVVDIQVKEG